MTDEWSLRNEILRTTHRWPIIFTFCLGGILLGWAMSFFWPSPQRAAKEIYVGLDVNHALNDRNASEHAGVQFNNPDDYKNWQMTNLNVFVKMDLIVAETLSRLKQQDQFWMNVERKDFTKTLNVNWRNAGVWRLVVEGDDLSHNSQAIATWHDVVLEYVQHAVEEAQKSLALDAQLSALATTQAQMVTQLAELTHSRETMESWLTAISLRPEDQLISQSEFAQIQQAFSDTIPAHTRASIIDTLPAQGAPNRKFIEWLEVTITALDQEILTTQSQIQALEKQNQEVFAHFSETSRRSFGLSANLHIREISSDPPQNYTVRPTGLLILLGGLLGLFIWTALWLSGIALRSDK
ncbi:hypothetical protein ACFLUC_01315 [Chloroflexota bacterium]